MAGASAALERGPPYRAGHDGRDDRGTDGGARPQARRHQALGRACRRAQGARPHPAALGAGEQQLSVSRTVLRRYGNMASATVVFVLEQALRARPPMPGDSGITIALEPGFAAEGALLRW
ncbi:MAG: 3-oxoacyl-[acyl-carrier-protein] synthase III C-terminal domain-containing protein [Candidatus Rokuibacteriota bacterium]